MLVDIEGHGREELFADVDLSRTVGWFTAISPVWLEAGEADGPGDVLKAVKEQLRQMPRGGVGYGVLRYLNAEVGAELQRKPQAQIVFNYLGQLDNAFTEQGTFGPAPESIGPVRHGQARRRYELEINSSVMNGTSAGRVDLQFRPVPRGTIEELAGRYLEALRALIRHLPVAEAGGFTPSDVAGADLSQDELDRFVDSAAFRTGGLQGPAGIEAIHLLSPTQQGILFHSLYAGASGVYVQRNELLARGRPARIGLPASVAEGARAAWQPAHRLSSGKSCGSRCRSSTAEVPLTWQELDWRPCAGRAAGAPGRLPGAGAAGWLQPVQAPVFRLT